MDIVFFQKAFFNYKNLGIFFTDPKNNSYYRPYFSYVFYNDSSFDIIYNLAFLFVENETILRVPNKLIITFLRDMMIETEFLVTDLDDVCILLSDFFSISIEDIEITKYGEKIILHNVYESDKDEDAVRKLRLSSFQIQKSFEIIRDKEDEIIRKFRLSSLIRPQGPKKVNKNVFTKYVRFSG